MLATLCGVVTLNMAEHQLRCALRDLLQWDEGMVQTAVEKVRHSALHRLPEAIDSLIENHMGGDILCRAAVEAYAAELMAHGAPVPRQTSSIAHSPPSHPSSARSRGPSTLHSRQALPGSMPPPTSSHNPQQQYAATHSQTRAPQSAQRTRPLTSMPPTDALPVGYPSRQRLSRRKAPALPFAHAAIAALTKSVFNCLQCGKVYDCRHGGQAGLNLMNQRGACLFCGNPIPVAAAACQAATNSDERASGGGVEEIEAQYATADAEKARAFKDRLVEFDRTAARRTTVIDDQGDYYAIESNAWLSPEERSEMKARLALEEQALEERKKRTVVTIDLLGRRVIMEDPTKEHSGAKFERAHDSAVAAAAATRAAAPQGGGAGAEVAEVAAKRLQALQNFRVTPAVPAGSDAPVFLPERARAVHVRRVEARGAPGNGAQRLKRHGVWADRPAPAPAHDVFDQFAADVEVLYAEALEAEAAADARLAGAAGGSGRAVPQAAAV